MQGQNSSGMCPTQQPPRQTAFLPLAALQRWIPIATKDQLAVHRRLRRPSAHQRLPLPQPRLAGGRCQAGCPLGEPSATLIQAGDRPLCRLAGAFEERRRRAGEGGRRLGSVQITRPCQPSMSGMRRGPPRHERREGTAQHACIAALFRSICLACIVFAGHPRVFLEARLRSRADGARPTALGGRPVAAAGGPGAGQGRDRAGGSQGGAPAL